MNKIYINTMNNIVINESAQEAMISKLISQRDKAVGAKPKRRFTWSKRWIGVIASASAVLIFCAIFFPVTIFKNGGGSRKYQYDYYREYKFELPFDHKISHTTNNLHFDTALTLELMTEAINDAGYKASLYEFDNEKRIFITATYNNFSYYYIIYDKIHLEYPTRYTLGDLVECISRENPKLQYDKKIMVFLFPLHFSRQETGVTSTKKIYCTFDEFAGFYEATGKNDATIDRENKTVTFFCEGSIKYSWGDANWARGNVIMRYIESESGNYIDIQEQL